MCPFLLLIVFWALQCILLTPCTFFVQKEKEAFFTYRHMFYPSIEICLIRPTRFDRYCYSSCPQYDNSAYQRCFPVLCRRRLFFNGQKRRVAGKCCCCRWFPGHYKTRWCCFCHYAGLRATNVRQLLCKHISAVLMFASVVKKSANSCFCWTDMFSHLPVGGRPLSSSI